MTRAITADMTLTEVVEVLTEQRVKLAGLSSQGGYFMASVSSQARRIRERPGERFKSRTIAIGGTPVEALNLALAPWLRTEVA